MELVRKGDVDGIIDLMPDDFVEDMFDIGEFKDLQWYIDYYVDIAWEKDSESSPNNFRKNWRYTVDSMEYYKDDRIKMNSFTSAYPYSALEYNSFAGLRDVCVAKCTVNYTSVDRYDSGYESAKDLEQILKITIVNVNGKWYPVKIG